MLDNYYSANGINSQSLIFLSGFGDALPLLSYQKLETPSIPRSLCLRLRLPLCPSVTCYLPMPVSTSPQEMTVCNRRVDLFAVLVDDLTVTQIHVPSFVYTLWICGTFPLSKYIGKQWEYVFQGLCSLVINCCWPPVSGALHT